MVEAGRDAYERHHWAEAFARLSAEDASSLGAGDLERLATAAYLSGHDEESTDAWTLAHRRHLDAGDWAEAVRCAFWLGFGLIERGHMAQGSGWLARGRDLVEQQDLGGVEVGYLLVPEALMAAEAGKHSMAHDAFGQALAIGQRFDDKDLQAMGRLGRGQVLLRMGRRSVGLGLLDEAMVSVSAGELSPQVAGIVYCAVIDECQHAFDVVRAQEWTDALSRWCDTQPGLVPYRGQCLVHRAQVMQLHGAWSEALEEAMRARARLETPRHPALGMAHYQLGDLHRLRGELDAAEESYRLANEWGRLPQPGLALLRLAQGRPESAVRAIERAVEEAGDVATRTRMLPAQVEILLAAGRVEEAGLAAAELGEAAAGAGAPYLEAAAAHARGAVLLAEGEPDAAREPLREAWRRWRELDAPYEAAGARVLIAAACQAVDDHDGAELERDAARVVFEALGAAPALGHLDEVLGRGPGGHPDLEVTARELQVLRLVAEGRTNREIADELVISPKTVERHLSNVYTKLGLSNRAAATAYAYDHNLV